MTEISLIQGIIIAVIAAVVGLDFYLEALFIFRPIIVAPLVGLVLGDLQSGLIIGGLTELIYVGLTPVGGTQPPNMVLAAIMATVLNHVNGGSPLTSISLSLPFSFMMQYVILFFYTTYSFAMKFADEAAEEADTAKISIINFTLGGITASSYFIIVFLSTYLAQDSIRWIVSNMPEWLTHSFTILGGILPAIGFGILLKMQLRMETLAYFIIGFLLVVYGSFGNLLPIALIGFALALINYYGVSSKTEKKGDEHEGI